MSRGGATLVELLVALVILEVGLLGVVVTLVLAARSVASVTLLEHGITETAWTLDSLSASGWQGGGARRTAGGEVVWSAGEDGIVWVEFKVAEEPVVRVWTDLGGIAP